jgi:hypothetical protein
MKLSVRVSRSDLRATKVSNESNQFSDSFNRPLDLMSIYQEYLSLKKEWTKEDMTLRDRRKRMGTELGYTLE